MARTIIPIQYPISAGLTPAYATPDTTNNNMYWNDPYTMLHIKNASGGSLTVSFVFPNTVDGVTISPSTITIPNNQERFVRKDWVVYNQPGSSADAGYTYLNFSTATSVSVAVFHP